VDVPPCDLPARLHALSARAQGLLNSAMLVRPLCQPALVEARRDFEGLLEQMISIQEELDWQAYRWYGLVDEDLSVPNAPPIKFGQRAFEIVLARRLASGELVTSWFERHQSTPTLDLPSDWPAEYRELVEKRIVLAEKNADLALIERPEYKRRWNIEPWEQR